MDLLSTCDFVKKMKKVTKDEVHIEIEIPANFIDQNSELNVEFLIVIGSNFPLSGPKVFCRTGVC